jgi:hypothetical protein
MHPDKYKKILILHIYTTKEINAFGWVFFLIVAVFINVLEAYFN